MNATTPPTTTAPALLARLLRQGLHVVATSGDTLQVWPANALDDDTRAAIAWHKAELIALLTGTHGPTLEAADDERSRCCDCYHLQAKGNCAMAWRGLLHDAPRWFTPVKDVLWRCHLFCGWPQ
ncbi:hypothetical protein [Pseudorhodoferax sp.]|uniref:hypothetical protein n=1 Tax=Pseudorhodoferax sp. TaxID=1993553 RepID=UPI002DD64B51|nr:hypothetical protein [Pseudorhodoferax sp.]